jgi:hypothetical protein
MCQLVKQRSEGKGNLVSKTEILEAMIAKGRLTAKEIHENPFLKHNIELNALTQALLRMVRQQLVDATMLPQRMKGPGKKPKGFKITHKGFDYLRIKEDKKHILKKPTIIQSLGSKLDSLDNSVTSFINEQRQRWKHEDLVKLIENLQEINEMREKMRKDHLELLIAVYKFGLMVGESQRERMASERFNRELEEFAQQFKEKIVDLQQKKQEALT